MKVFRALLLFTFYFSLLALHSSLFAQKEIYIPIEWQQGSLDYSFDRSAESENFIVFWGPLAGTDPTQAPADIVFDPQTILSTAEGLYKFYIDTIQFVNDDSGLISQYKIILVMLHTWAGLEGWAFGGNYDGVVGAMWMHPHAALSGPTLAHEFTHTLQNYAWMMNPGHGFINNSYVGFFWETHAEFMALQKYPSVALEFDMARWLNTSHFHWSSTRHHYQAFIFLQFIKEKDGIEMINRLWSESIIGEHPLETYKRLKGITQEDLHDLFAEYAMRNVTWDYEIGDLLRTRVSTINPVFIKHQTIIPERIDSARNWYRIQNHLAPQDYGYNIIRLYPKQLPNCDERNVYINFKAQYIFPDYEEAGLNFGLVAVNSQNEARYSEVYNGYEETMIAMQDDETELYLVVIGTPRNHHNYDWEIGFPKIYRYPYEFRLKGAVPEGFQEGFREPTGLAGTYHTNGGGFVGENAVVSPSAYVGPHAQVLDGAIVSGNARIEDYAIIQHSARVEDNAVISGLAIIGEDAHVYGNALVKEQAHVFGSSEVYDSAVVRGNSLIFLTSAYENAELKDNVFTWGANLHGDINLGGDAEFFTECSDGTYLQVEFAYNRNCDGLDDHPANVDVTERFHSKRKEGQHSLICGGLVQSILTEFNYYLCEEDTFYYNGAALGSGLHEFLYETPNGIDSIVQISIYYYNSPILVGDTTICKGDTINVFGQTLFEEGQYYVEIIDMFGCIIDGYITVHWYNMDTSVVRFDDRLVAQATASIFQWYDCETNLAIPGANQRTFIPTFSGSFKVEVTNIHGCKAFSECFNWNFVSTKEFKNIQFEILPNPANNYLKVLIPNTTTNIQINIYDMLGQLQLKETFDTGTSNQKINIKELSPGVYTLRMSDKTGSFTTQIFSKI